MLILGEVACSKSSQTSSADSVAPSNMRRIGTIDDRFQLYNIEMVEVTGGRFWKPYKDSLSNQILPGAQRELRPGLPESNLPWRGRAETGELWHLAIEITSPAAPVV